MGSADGGVGWGGSVLPRLHAKLASTPGTRSGIALIFAVLAVVVGLLGMHSLSLDHHVVRSPVELTEADGGAGLHHGASSAGAASAHDLSPSSTAPPSGGTSIDGGCHAGCGDASTLVELCMAALVAMALLVLRRGAFAVLKMWAGLVFVSFSGLSADHVRRPPVLLLLCISRT